MVERISSININVRVMAMLLISGSGIISGMIMDSFLGWIFIIVGLSTIVFHIYIVSISEKSNVNNIIKYNETFLQNSKIKYDDYFYGEDGGTILLVNEKEQSLYVMQRENLIDEYKINKISFNQVVESGIIEDDHTITKVSKSGLIGRSLLGGAIAGGFGAVIGGVTAEKTTTEQVKKVTLSIVVDEVLNPVYNIAFLLVENPIAKDNPYYKSMFEKCTLWHKRMSVIINRNEK